MRLGRALVVFLFSAAAIVTSAQGCQDPTQVTLELSLDKKATCSEIAAGTAITVGIEPFDTESRVASGFVTARTTDCNPGNNQIGTLVVTPSDQGKASIIVVVGYKDNDPTSCKPPGYDGCIVARRRFAFADHTRLRMPITIDPDCAGVPCDAFSTCNKGRCYDSETTCTGSDCENPGELTDGGVDEASVVEPDASGFDSGPIDDGGPGDGSPPDSGPIVRDGGGSALCSASNTLVCNGISCGGSLVCCGDNPAGCSGSCASPTEQLCCVDGVQDGCPVGYVCARPTKMGPPGKCQLASPTKDAAVTATPYCTVDNVLYCDSMNACSGPIKTCCGPEGNAVCNAGAATCNGQKRWCCTQSDCGFSDGGPQLLCLRVAQPGGMPGTTPAGTCQ